MAERKKRDFFLHPVEAVRNRKRGALSDTSSIGSAHESAASGSTHDQEQGPGSAIDSVNLISDRTQDASTNPIAAINIPPGEYWDHAYERLKSDEPELIEDYEKVVSKRLKDSDAQDDRDDSNVENIISSSRDERGTQMNRLLRSALDRMDRHSKAKGRLGAAANVALSMKSSIGTLLKPVAPAALAWGGLCLALEMLVLNPLNEAESNKDGISVVISRMKWYSELSVHIQRQGPSKDDRFANLRAQMAENIFSLYQELLEYIVLSVCVNCRNSVLKFSRNIIKLDDWDGSLEAIDKKETSVKQDMQDFGRIEHTAHLRDLVDYHLTQKQDDVMKACFVKDMEAGKEGIQHRNDRLLPECYQWVLDTDEYQDLVDWRSENTKRVLWLSGDAGRGKTMLMMGIVEDLASQLQIQYGKPELSYFFCIERDPKANSALSVLRGLIWMLLRRQRSLIKHLEEDFADAGQEIFEGSSAFHRLRRIFTRILQDKDFERIYLVVDALDECKMDRSLLLDVIAQTSKFENSKVKWILSSRNNLKQEVRDKLDQFTNDHRSLLVLETNSEAVSLAIKAYIDKKVSELRNRQLSIFRDAGKPDRSINELNDILRRVRAELLDRADGTFLWVALAVKRLKEVDATGIIPCLEKMPSNLFGLYSDMLRAVRQDPSNDLDVYRLVFLTVVTAFRPLDLHELEALVGMDPMSDSKRLIRSCGLLVLQENESTCTVLFVHQSAKDYLIQNLREIRQIPQKKDEFHILSRFFPNGHSAGHAFIASRSLETMKGPNGLKRDIYGLNDPGAFIGEIRKLKTGEDNLRSLRYSCTFWVDHLENMEPKNDQMDLLDDGGVHRFLTRYFLYWVEALSLMQDLSVASSSIQRLTRMITNILSSPETPSLRPLLPRFFVSPPASGSEILALLQDFLRFLQTNQPFIQDYPLQTYSLLVFAPSESLTRTLFRGEIPGWIKQTELPETEKRWNPCIRTTNSFWLDLCWRTYKPCNGSHIAYCAPSKLVLFDIESFRELKTISLLGEDTFSDDFERPLDLLPDGSVAVAGNDGRIHKWDSHREECVYVSEEVGTVQTIALNPDGRIACSFGEGSNYTIKVLDPSHDSCIQLDGHVDRVNALHFSPDGCLFSGSIDKTVKLWDLEKQACNRSLEASGAVKRIVYSAEHEVIAAGLSNGKIQIWNSRTGVCQKTFSPTGLGAVKSMTFHPKGILILGSYDGFNGFIQFWSLDGICLKEFRAGYDGISLIALSARDQIISLDLSGVVKVWDPNGEPPDGEDPIKSSASSPDSSSTVTLSHHSIRVWDQNCVCRRRINLDPENIEHSNPWIVISPGGYIAICSSIRGNGIIQLWNCNDEKLPSIEVDGLLRRITFFHDGRLLIHARYHETDQCFFQIWDMNGSRLEKIDLTGEWQLSKAMGTSPDGNFAMITRNGKIGIWNQKGDHIAKLNASFPEGDNTSSISWAQIEFSLDCQYLIVHYYSESSDRTRQMDIWNINKCEWLGSSDSEDSGKTEIILQTPSMRHHNDYSFSKQWIRWKGKNVLSLPDDLIRPRSPESSLFRFAPDGFGIFTAKAPRPLIFRITDQTPFSEHTYPPSSTDTEYSSSIKNSESESRNDSKLPIMVLALGTLSSVSTERSAFFFFLVSFCLFYFGYSYVK